MKKQLLSVVIFVMLLVVGLTGCFEETKDDSKEDITNGDDGNKENVTNESIFIGKWLVVDAFSNSSIGDTYTFYENGKLEITFVGLQNNGGPSDFYDFKVEEDTLCFKLISDWSCFDYEFFNENSFVLLLSGAMTLERFEGYTTSPLIEFEADSINNSLSVISVNQPDLYWDDFEVIGNAVIPSGEINVGSIIVNCTGNILIRHISSKEAQGAWAFPAPT